MKYLRIKVTGWGDSPESEVLREYLSPGTQHIYKKPGVGCGDTHLYSQNWEGSNKRDSHLGWRATLANQNTPGSVGDHISKIGRLTEEN